VTVAASPARTSQRGTHRGGSLRDPRVEDAACR
jgi:hypothetical protein